MLSFTDSLYLLNSLQL